MRTSISHEFVDIIPDDLADGVIYVCIPYTTAVHQCLCGCGHEVVTPLAPQQWSLTFNGQTISLTPSIGNWSFPCQSHYWIRAGQVHPARLFTGTEIAHLRAADRESHQDRYEAESAAPSRHIIAARRRWTQLINWLRHHRPHR